MRRRPLPRMRQSHGVPASQRAAVAPPVRAAHILRCMASCEKSTFIRGPTEPFQDRFQEPVPGRLKGIGCVVLSQISMQGSGVGLLAICMDGWMGGGVPVSLIGPQRRDPYQPSAIGLQP
jgi:hypothetical protein